MARLKGKTSNSGLVWLIFIVVILILLYLFYRFYLRPNGMLDLGF